MSLEGKVLLVTGAGSGIGRAASLLCAGKGAAVVAVDIAGEAAEGTAAAVRDAGGRAIAVAADITEREQVGRAFALGVEAFGKVDVTFNSAGSTRLGTIGELSDKDFDFVVDLNLKGTFVVCSEALKVMLPAGGGRLINCASYCGVREEFANGAYCAAKAGVIMLTRVLAMEQGPNNVSAVCISPGNIDTELLQSAFNERARIEDVSVAELYRRAGAKVPLGRVGRPEEIAGLVAYLASDDSHYINGENIMITGGHVMR